MYRILLVDDEILVRDAIRENIDWASMDCVLAGDCENGKQAWDFIQKEPVDIVLTDILMPYVDGLELARLIHEGYPDTVVVIFSGFGEFEYAKKAMQYNVSEYLLKPVTSAELRQVIGKMKEIVDEKRRKRQEMERLDRTQEQYFRNEALIRSKALEALVNQTRDIRESLEELRRLEIELTPGSCKVAVFDLDAYSEIAEVDAEKLQESALMAFVLYNISTEIVTEEKLGIAYQEGDSRVCILFMTPKTKEADLAVQEVCRRIQRMVFETIGIVASAGIGGWVREPEELRISRNQALELLKRRYLTGPGLLLDYEQCILNGTADITGELEELDEAVHGGEEERIRSLMLEISEKIRETMAERTRALVRLQQVIRRIGEIRMTLSEPKETVFRLNEEYLRKAAEERTFGDAVERVTGYAVDTSLLARRMNSTGAQMQARLASDYIRQNYSDPTLSLNDLCSYLNVSVSYFSSFYKEQTGETFTETLGKIRMEKAKELLRNTTLRNYEIAEKVGFSDPHYFGIAFKKATGQTPMEYAKEKRR